MFLTGTLLNVATVLLGTLIGLLLGSRMPHRMQSSVRVASFLPALLAPIFIRLAELVRGLLA